MGVIALAFAQDGVLSLIATTRPARVSFGVLVIGTL